MKWFTDKVSEDMAEPDIVVDAMLDAPEDESEPVLPVSSSKPKLLHWGHCPRNREEFAGR